MEFNSNENYCPRCGGYDCVFNGLSYECDDCGYTWGGFNPEEDSDQEYDY